MFLKFLFSKLYRAESEENSNILFKIICGVLLIMTVTTFIALIQQPGHAVRFLTAIALLWVASLAFLLVLKEQNARTISVVYISFLLLMILAFAYSGGGIKGHGIRLLPMIVLLSGLTLGRKPMWLFAIATSVGGLLLVAAGYFELLPSNEPISQAPLSFWIYSVSGIFLLSYMEHLSVGRFNKTVDRLEQELNLRNQSEEKYRVIFESFQDIFYQTDMTGNIILITPSLQKRMGYHPTEVIGKNIREFYFKSERQADFINLILDNGSVYNHELELLTKEGKIMNVLASSHIIYNSNGNPIAIEGSLHDITQRKKDENLLKAQNEKLMRVAHLQSHIVRKPVANVLGIIHLLDLQNPNDPTNLELIPKLEIASKELDIIINEIVQNTKEIKDML
ncbi:PAS domain-containing protein [Flavobacterium sp. XGLA_31]|uniref:PAS domain-containing protein n=1 Tax=Flavobacterium sp. XGLA_31 TaxID=3447666 RepID=UPI003F3ED77C